MATELKPTALMRQYWASQRRERKPETTIWALVSTGKFSTKGDIISWSPTKPSDLTVKGDYYEIIEIKPEVTS